jgi:hypothetical protein
MFGLIDMANVARLEAVIVRFEKRVARAVTAGDSLKARVAQNAVDANRCRLCKALIPRRVSLDDLF